jgi:hypothetical protein
MTIKKLFILTLIFASITNYTYNHITSVELSQGSDWTSMRIHDGVAHTKGVIYSGNDIFIIKEASGKITANYIKNLHSINNAFVTSCPNFDILEHGANKPNKTLCNNPEILHAYEEFKRNHEKNKN